jgi:hypothetical protein
MKRILQRPFSMNFGVSISLLPPVKGNMLVTMLELVTMKRMIALVSMKTKTKSMMLTKEMIHLLPKDLWMLIVLGQKERTRSKSSQGKAAPEDEDPSIEETTTSAKRGSFKKPLCARKRNKTNTSRKKLKTLTEDSNQQPGKRKKKRRRNNKNNNSHNNEIPQGMLALNINS